MVSFSFPDLFAMYYVPNWVSQGKINVYKLVEIKKDVCPWLSATWPPLYYYTIGAYLWLIKSLGLLENTLFTSSVCPVWSLILNHKFLFWAKFHFLILHFASAWVFSLLFKKRRDLWFVVWYANPVSIFVSFIEGQFEIIPTFFLLLFLYFVRTKRELLAFLALGLGGAYKHFPFLLAIPAIIILAKSLSQIFAFTAVMIVPYILTVLPVFSPEWFHSLFFSENFKMLTAGITVGGRYKISFYLLVYIFLVFKLFFEKKKERFGLLIKYMFLFSLIYFLFAFWSPQRLLFLLPSLLLVASRSKRIFRRLPLLYFFYFAYILFLYPGLFDQTLLRPLFSHIDTSITPFLYLVSFNILSSQFIQQATRIGITMVLAWFGFLTLKGSLNDKIWIDKKMILLSDVSLVVYLVLVFSFTVFL